MYVLFYVRCAGRAILRENIGRAELGRPGCNYLNASCVAYAAQWKGAVGGTCAFVGYVGQGGRA